MRLWLFLHTAGIMVGLARHTLGGTAIRATRGTIGVGDMVMTHSGAGALVGVVILTILDLFHHITTTTTIHHTTAVGTSRIVRLWLSDQIVRSLVVDHLIWVAVSRVLVAIEVSIADRVVR